MYNIVRNFKTTVKIIGFSIFTIFWKTKYFIYTDFEKIKKKIWQYYFNAYLYHELTYDDGKRGL